MPKMALEKRVQQFFNIVLLDQERGTGLFRYFGGYWEVIYPILKKYDPQDLNEYEGLLCDQFTYFNPEVKELLDAGDEESNWALGINYFNARRQYYSASDIHYIEPKDDEKDPIPYMPNQYVSFMDD